MDHERRPPVVLISFSLFTVPVLQNSLLLVIRYETTALNYVFIIYFFICSKVRLMLWDDSRSNKAKNCHINPRIHPSNTVNG